MNSLCFVLRVVVAINTSAGWPTNPLVLKANTIHFQTPRFCACAPGLLAVFVHTWLLFDSWQRAFTVGNSSLSLIVRVVGVEVKRRKRKTIWQIRRSVDGCSIKIWLVWNSIRQPSRCIIYHHLLLRHGLHILFILNAHPLAHWNPVVN